jgi:hypothetical protein
MVLETQPDSRLMRRMVLDARSFDLDCPSCHRYWCLVVHTPRSLQLLRMRRLAAAIGAGRATPTATPAPAAAASAT